MKMKDGVNKNRQEKMKAMLERQLISESAEESNPETYLPLQEPFFYEQDREELDPEAVWKSNPNPWASWSEDNSFGDKRRFVKGPDIANQKDPSFGPHKYTFRKELQWKLAIALLIFATIWALFRYDNEWTQGGQALVKRALTDEIDFAAAATWYKETFAGAPSFIPIFQNESQTAVGADGTVILPIVAPLHSSSLIRTFAELLNGIELAGGSEQEVVAVETGRVIVVTNEEKDGATIVIQHANNRVTVYGLLGTTDVKVNDWVEAGDPIGHLLTSVGSEPSMLYFAVKQNGLYIDPVGVIPID
ncbi:stage IV sporulation protein FA [Paenibacillus castaneae]|nr:M23 family metallopeptidase [Paenibacillus castaneae]NIK75963.1 stage IV sporulation protein FA [Paenibacillus castaneae]